jgi:hypothetical protein
MSADVEFLELNTSQQPLLVKKLNYLQAPMRMAAVIEVHSCQEESTGRGKKQAGLLRATEWENVIIRAIDKVCDGELVVSGSEKHRALVDKKAQKAAVNEPCDAWAALDDMLKGEEKPFVPRVEDPEQLEAEATALGAALTSRAASIAAGLARVLSDAPVAPAVAAGPRGGPPGAPAPGKTHDRAEALRAAEAPASRRRGGERGRSDDAGKGSKGDKGKGKNGKASASVHATNGGKASASVNATNGGKASASLNATNGMAAARKGDPAGKEKGKGKGKKGVADAAPGSRGWETAGAAAPAARTTVMRVNGDPLKPDDGKCRGGCGFFGNDQWNGYCSLCAKKHGLC